MYKICFILFFLYSSSVSATLPDTTLKNICSQVFKQNREKCYWSPGTEIHITEPIEDKSGRTKVFLLDDCLKINEGVYHLYEMFSQSYIIDKDSGFLYDLIKRKTFNKITKNIKMGLSNIEVCYLYLFLNHLEPFGVNGYDEYSKELTAHIDFLQYFKLSFDKCKGAVVPDHLQSQISHDIQKSTNRSIYIYTRMGANEKFAVCRYQFRFGNRNDLKTIKREFF